ncbi:MAG: Gldg family protein, partial [Clostridia bacterium]|nr:Gldg family protein [Clostridia bacterium]
MDKKSTPAKGGKSKFFSSRRFKYGAVATVFVVVFIAAVILLNAVISAIDSKYNLYVDLTEDQLFTIRESTVESVRQELDDYKTATGQNFTITITFLRARDQLIANQQQSWVVTLAESYAETFPEIRVEYKEDLLTHPDHYAFYADLGYTITANSIIVSSSLSRASFDVFTFDSCLVYNEAGDTVWAFKGEMKFNAAILSITAQEQPVVAFTTGHGESKPEKLVEIFLNCGFKVVDVDLSAEEVSDDTKILVVSSPKKDFSALEDDRSVSEYTRLADYLNQYRSALVIMPPSTPELPVLDELLSDWGVKVCRNQIVQDDTSSVAGDNQMLYVSYPESKTVAAAITGSLTKLSNPPRSVSYVTAPIEILHTGDGEIYGVESVLTSSANSYVEVAGEKGPEKKAGPFNLMTVS